MNNPRLLVGMLVACLTGNGACSLAQSVLSLEDIFRSAEANSAQLRPCYSAEKEADQDISVAKSAWLPDINAHLSVSYIAYGFTTARDYSDCQRAPIPHLGTGLGLKVTQPVYSGGAISASIDLAKLRSSASRYSTELCRDNLRFRLAGDYLDLYKCHNLRTVILSNIESAKEVLADMKARYEQGTLLLNDITRYELLLSNYELQLVKIDNTIQILNNNLVVNAGLPAGTQVVPDTMLLKRSLPDRNESQWQHTALDNAPSLKLAQYAVNMNEKVEKIEKAKRLPSIGVEAVWTMDGPILVEVPPINRNLSYWYIGLGISYDLSSLYKANKSLKHSRIATNTARERLVAERENINVGVRADYVKYLEAYQELKTCNKQIELSERNYNTVSRRFAEGMALITDMLDAADSRLDAQQQLVNARINIIYYYYKLLFTTGTI